MDLHFILTLKNSMKRKLYVITIIENQGHVI